MINKLQEQGNTLSGSFEDSFLTIARYDPASTYGPLFDNVSFFHNENSTTNVLTSSREAHNLGRSYTPKTFIRVHENHEPSLIVDTLERLNSGGLRAETTSATHFLGRFTVSYSMENIDTNSVESPYGDYKRWKALQKLRADEITALDLMDTFILLKLKFGGE